jgi:hypothetical protein
MATKTGEPPLAPAVPWWHSAAAGDIVLGALVLTMLAATLPTVAPHEGRLWIIAYICAVVGTLLAAHQLAVRWLRLSMGGVAAMLVGWAVWLLHGAVFRAVEARDERVSGLVQTVLFALVAALSWAPAMQTRMWPLLAANVLAALAFPHRDAVATEVAWPLALAKVYGFAVQYVLADMIGSAVLDRDRPRRIGRPAGRSSVRAARSLNQSLWLLFAMRYALPLWTVQCAVLAWLARRHRGALGRVRFAMWPRVHRASGRSKLGTGAHIKGLTGRGWPQ